MSAKKTEAPAEEITKEKPAAEAPEPTEEAPQTDDTPHSKSLVEPALDVPEDDIAQPVELPVTTREYFDEKAEVDSFMEQVGEWLRTLSDSVDVADLLGKLKQLEEPARKLMDQASDLGKTHFGLDHLERAWSGLDSDEKPLDWFRRTLSGIEGLVDLLSSLPLPILNTIPAGRVAKLLLFFQQSRRVNTIKSLVKIGRIVEEAIRGETPPQQTADSTDGEPEDTPPESES